MTQLDDRILEYLARHRWASPCVLASEASFRASEGRLRERCQMLKYAGLIHPLHDDMYELTTWGVRYLAGDLDADHQPWPTVDRALRG